MSSYLTAQADRESLVLRKKILFTRLLPGGRCAVSVDILSEVLGAAASYGVQTLHANLRHLRSPLICRVMNRVSVAERRLSLAALV